MGWSDILPYDPLPWLLVTDEGSLRYQVRHDLMAEKGLNKRGLWLDPEVRRMVRTQMEDGSWRYHGNRSGESLKQNYEYLETFKTLGFLVELFKTNREHGTVARAVEYLLSLQTEEGDVRGIYGNQYSPNYTAGVAELAIKAGYDKDRRVGKIFDWLLSVRQSDGGWAIPIRTQGNISFRDAMVSDLIPPERSRPSAHTVTGIVLRAFAAHPKMRRSDEARQAGELLRSRLFLRDAYRDRGAPAYWTKFTFPFWFNDLASALDTLSLLGVPEDDAYVQKAISWLCSMQRPKGSFDFDVLAPRGHDVNRWVAFSFCRSLKRFYG